ncbi:MAG TPA: Stp1/IreP family PP2C-type Ser/Thr phosphatase [Nitrospiraceae bacterium]|nr:Stp1/IreP family PP2C-type Ser/Thr phosphatase [Nitrospiraceae bacterium]
MAIHYGARSDTGLKRSRNEDCFCADPESGLYVVCDGMGGHQSGKVASTLAVEAIAGHVQQSHRDGSLPMVGYDDPAFSRQTNRLASAIRVANHVIHQEACRRLQCAGMGTTVVAAVLDGPILSIAHVGDSRLYLIRDDRIQPLTADHSVVAEQIREGLLTEEEAARSPQKNIVTRALGVEITVDVELSEIPVMRDDVLLLCSDGLTQGVSPRDILHAVRSEHDVQAASDRLIDMANAAGGEDNTTVVLVIVPQDTRPGVWRQIRDRIRCSR